MEGGEFVGRGKGMGELVLVDDVVRLARHVLSLCTAVRAKKSAQKILGLSELQRSLTDLGSRMGRHRDDPTADPIDPAGDRTGHGHL